MAQVKYLKTRKPINFFSILVAVQLCPDFKAKSWLTTQKMHFSVCHFFNHQSSNLPLAAIKTGCVFNLSLTRLPPRRKQGQAAGRCGWWYRGCSSLEHTACLRQVLPLQQKNNYAHQFLIRKWCVIYLGLVQCEILTSWDCCFRIILPATFSSPSHRVF